MWSFYLRSQETTDKKKKENYGLQTHLASYLFFYSLWNKSFSTISWKECTAWELWVKFDSSRGKMRTIALEAACPIALRNYSKKAAGEVSICVILVKGARMQSHTYFCRRFLLVTGAFITMKEFNASLGMRKCMNWFHNIFWKYLADIFSPYVQLPPLGQKHFLSFLQHLAHFLIVHSQHVFTEWVKELFS